MAESSVVTGLFKDRESAEQAYQTAVSRGYTSKDIDVVMSDETRQRHFSGQAETELGNKAAEGAGIGGALGGTVGAIAAGIAAVGTSIAIPGLGIVLAGPVAAALAGAGAGAATGGLLGALVGWNIPEERLKHYESGVKEGGILMGIRPRTDDDAEYFARNWETRHAENVNR
jgi:hypothetical protein